MSTSSWSIFECVSGFIADNIIWLISYGSYDISYDSYIISRTGSFHVERLFFDDANKKDLKYEKWEKIEFNINERGFE